MAVKTLTSVRPILEKRLAGGRLNLEEIIALLQSPDLLSIGQTADTIRRQFHPENRVSFVIDRNINYTNVCVAQCSFCAFKRDVGDEEGYVLAWEEIDQKCQELVDQGGTQVLLQGGLNPALKLPYYQELIGRIQSKFPLDVHGFSPAELFYLAKISRMSVLDCLKELQAAGLRSVPGGGGEILVDRVRDVIGKGKVYTNQWFEVMEAAQSLGMNTSVTTMYGHVESVEEQAMTLLKIRESGDKHGGYGAYCTWDFQAEHNKLGEIVKADSSLHLGTGWDYLRYLAVSRIVIDNIRNFQVSWVTQGPKAGQLALHFGANDFGGTMMEENVVSASGTVFHVGPPEAVDFIKDAGFKPVQRNTFYQVVREF